MNDSRISALNDEFSLNHIGGYVIIKNTFLKRRVTNINYCLGNIL